MHDLEDLRRVDALDAAHVVEQAERRVACGELSNRARMLDVAAATNAERLAALEGALLGAHDATHEVRLEMARELRLVAMETREAGQKAARARQAEHGADVREHAAIARW